VGVVSAIALVLVVNGMEWKELEARSVDIAGGLEADRKTVGAA
jgi:hypothetical protein